MIQFRRTFGVVMLFVMLLGGIGPGIADNIYDFTFNQHVWATILNDIINFA